MSHDGETHEIGGDTSTANGGALPARQQSLKSKKSKDTSKLKAPPFGEAEKNRVSEFSSVQHAPPSQPRRFLQRMLSAFSLWLPREPFLKVSNGEGQEDGLEEAVLQPEAKIRRRCGAAETRQKQRRATQWPAREGEGEGKREEETHDEGDERDEELEATAHASYAKPKRRRSFWRIPGVEGFFSLFH